MNNRDFTAEYQFQEYPKWVTLADGTPHLAQNADEEEVLIGDPANVMASDEIKGEAEAERQKLLQQAKDLGLKPHANTGADKLRKMIADAE